MNEKVHLSLLPLLREAARSLAQSEYAVTRELMANADAEAITRMVRSQIVQQLCSFAADHKILNDSSCFSMEDDLYKDITRFRARCYILSPAEFEKLMKLAFEAGHRRGMNSIP